MSRNFDRVHKNSEIVKEKLQISAGLGHYPSDSEDAPTCEMDKSHIRYVLKLIDLGYKKVNFWMKINVHMETYCPCPGTCRRLKDFPQGCTRNRREPVSREIIDGNMGLSMSVSECGEDFDSVSLRLRKRDDPYFKFIAEYQVYTDVRESTIYDDPEIVDELDYPKESRKGNDDWQVSYFEPWYQPLYYVRYNITVV